MSGVSWLDRGLFAAPGGRIAPPPIEPPRPRPVAPPIAPLRHSAQDFAGDNPEQDHQIKRMVPIALELARHAGAYGIIAGEIRTAAAKRSIITGFEKDRILSYIGRVPRAAGLRALPGKFRRSAVERSHGNLQQVWVLPEFAA